MAPTPQGALSRRVLSAAVGLPLLLAAIWAGGIWFVILATAVALGASWEYRRLCAACAPPLPLLPSLAFAPGLVVAARFGTEPLLGSLVVLPLLTLLFLLPGRRDSNVLLAYGMILGGVLYIGVPLALAVALREGPLGLEWLALALAAAFATDAAAYGVGRVVGRHLLAPTVSRGKTWEGAMGGLVGGVAAVVVLVWLADMPLAYWEAALLGLGLGALAQAGDLVESKLKRAAGVKDASGLVPGHGGLLDRLDSVVFVVVAVYYVALWRGM